MDEARICELIESTIAEDAESMARLLKQMDEREQAYAMGYIKGYADAIRHFNSMDFPDSEM